jgi:hypothetical protein
MIDDIAKEQDVSVRKAMKYLAGDTGVPYGTLKYWYYRDDESSRKTPPTQTPEKTNKAKAKVAAKIVKNISKAMKQDEEDALAAQGNRDGAKALADELGGAILAEELYDLFLKKVYELDEIVAASKELEDPIDQSKIIDQALRIARNVGWQEYKDFCLKCTFTRGLSNKKSRTVTYKVACSNRTCDNHIEKEKKKVKK